MSEQNENKANKLDMISALKAGNNASTQKVRIFNNLQQEDDLSDNHWSDDYSDEEEEDMSKMNKIGNNKVVVDSQVYFYF